ncbi:MAG: recombinase family protein [Ardenticatenaceae bacterium]|nr:recombinase family protein [Ardenticatenaceae bacterium]
MSPHPKINEGHRRRQAYVYIRQSTLKQVQEHQESQDLQYQLVKRAETLGWLPEQIVVIDEDLGKSAVSSQGRSGFQRLFTAVGTGQVGIILVTDVSRLARNCADWFQLLDIAASQDTLVNDSGGIYNPRAYDDRLLLGIKGAFSEAQWYNMRQQLQAARLNKAQRGELALRLPVGLERLASGQVRQSADVQVRGAINHVFALFRREGTARAVLRQLQAEGVQLPRQQRNVLGQRQVVWGIASYSQVYQILKLPAYAGAYAFGKRRREGIPGKENGRYARPLPPEKWQVLRHDTYPGYISWQEYEQNQATLAANWQATRFAAGAEAMKPKRPGKGRALLQGIALCGHCGRRLHVRYRDKPAYVCAASQQQHNQPRCQYVPYAHVDQAVTAAFLTALEPAALEAALTALDQMSQQRQALSQQWQQQLARADYEVELARLRYEQVDPRLRLVAAELEQRWEEALAVKAGQQAEWEQVQAEQLRPLTAADEALIRRLATDLPALWAASTTTLTDRKRLLRTLIQDVTLNSQQESGLTHIAIRWQTGAVSQLTAVRPQPGHPTHTQLHQRLKQLITDGHDDAQMAVILNTEGLVSSWHIKDDARYIKGQPVSYWTETRVGNLRRKLKLRLDLTGAGYITADAAATRLKVSLSVLLDWYRRGLLPGRQRQRGAPVWIRWDEALAYRVSGAAPRDLPWRTDEPPLLPLAQAPAHFGLTSAQMKAALQTNKYLTWRLEYGCHYRWYVQEKAAGSAEPANN